MKKTVTEFYKLGTASNPIYLFGSKDHYVLVEGGISTLSKLVFDQLSMLLPSLNLIKKWIITHAHYDHCGMLPELLPFFTNASVYASFEAINVFKDVSKCVKIYEWNNQIEKVKGLAIGYKINQGIPLHEIPFQVIKEGDRLDVNLEFPLHIIETTGHSKCSISIYDPNDDRVFVSDALGEYQEGNWFPLIFDNYENYISSIGKINEVGASFIAPGHHKMLHGTEALTAPEKSLKGAEKLLNAIRNLINLNYSEQRIVSKIMSLNANKNDFLPDELYACSIARLVNIIYTKINKETIHA